VCVCVGVVWARVGSGREYVVRWTDDTEATVTSSCMFGAFTPHRRLDVGDHALATHRQHFSPATVVSRPDPVTGKLTLKFNDGAVAYVMLPTFTSVHARPVGY